MHTVTFFDHFWGRKKPPIWFSIDKLNPLGATGWNNWVKNQTFWSVRFHCMAKNPKCSKSHHLHCKKIATASNNVCSKWCGKAFLFTWPTLNLANTVICRDGKASWGSGLEAMSDSWERTDWTLKEMEKEASLLCAWLLLCHHSPPPPHTQTACFCLAGWKIYWAMFSLPERLMTHTHTGLNEGLIKQWQLPSRVWAH